MKKLINEFFDRITPKLPGHCAILPKHRVIKQVQEPNTPIVEEKSLPPTPMTEKEKLIIDKLYALLGTKEVYSSYGSFSSNHYVYYYGFKIDDKNIVQLLKITKNEKTNYEVVNSGLKVLENPSTEAILELEKITEGVKHKIDIQNLEKEQEKLNNFLKL